MQEVAFVKKTKTNIQNLKTEIQSSNSSTKKITKFEFEARNINQYVDSIITGLKRINKEILQIMKESVLSSYKVTVDILQKNWCNLCKRSLRT